MKHNSKMLRAAAGVLGMAMALSAAPAAASAEYQGEWLKGDVNGDGRIDTYDVIEMRNAMFWDGTMWTGAKHLRCELNGDSVVDEKDLQLLADYVLGKDVTFVNAEPPIEPPTEKPTDEEPVFIDTRYYAVDAKYQNAWREDTNSGFLGEAYINYSNEIGSFIEWTVTVNREDDYEVLFYYANGTDVNRPVKLIVNGDREYGQYVDFEGTGSWTSWNFQTANVHLREGENTIKAYATTSNGGPNMDYIMIMFASDRAPHEKATQGKRMEKLSRGVSSAHAKNGNLVSWRLLATDNQETQFRLWKNGETMLGEFTTESATNYFDEGGTATDWYTIDTYVNGECTEFAQASTNFPNTNGGQSGAYFDIKLDQPKDMTMPDGSTCSYSPNDCSVGDVDGDGEYELFVKWYPSNAQDNANKGYTGNTYIDCYKLNGKKLWRVDLGRNIRSGAHYTQFMVYDFDGDNKAEMICKTSDGTVDGTGKVIGNANADYRTNNGYILSGNEFLTLFDGETGANLDTIDYKPGRGNINDWGDGYGNRVDRFTGCVAYLDGVNPYACFGRGYYTRTTMTAYGVSGKKLKEYWAFDTGHNSSVQGYGDGNHHCMAADVDMDGRQEVVLGAAVIDDNGKLLYTSGLKHGDALHVGDFDPMNPGVEIFQCHEETGGISYRDGKTGKLLFRDNASGDTGRCIADNLITGNGGAELVGAHNGTVYSATGDHKQVLTWAEITKWNQNSVVYWTDTLERAVLDRAMADQYGKGRVFTGDGAGYNNGSKSNACLTADILGDWREEMIFPLGTDAVRVFSTTYTTKYNLYSLMHNPQYRVQVASQNNGYNQPPHTDFYIDSTEYTRPEEQDIWVN